MSTSAPVASSLPARGVRQYINLQVRLIRFYLKYQPAIDAVLPPDILAAMHIIAAALPALQALNEPGPR